MPTATSGPLDAGPAQPQPPVGEDAGPPQADAGTLGSAAIAGFVHDSFRRPISGAAVRLSRRGSSSISQLARLTTDADGRFLRGGLPPGPLLVEVRAPGFQSRTLDEIRVTAQETRELEIQLQTGRRLAGRVVDDTGEPVAAVEITAVPPPASDSGDQLTTSDGEGRFSFTELGAGPYCLHGRKDPYADANACGLSPGAAVTLRLQRTGGVAGRVVRALGFTPFLEFRVGIRSEGGDDDSSGPTRTFRGRDGRFRFDGLRPGVYTVAVVAEGRWFAERSGVKILPGEITGDLSFELDATGRVRGRVVAASSGAPVVGAAVELLLGGRYSSRKAGRRRTNEMGLFEFDEVSAGRHQLNVEHPGYLPILLQQLSVIQSRGELVLLRMRRPGEKR